MFAPPVKVVTAPVVSQVRFTREWLGGHKSCLNLLWQVDAQSLIQKKLTASFYPHRFLQG